MQPPLVTVVVPCFNYGHLLGETLDSVRNQSLEGWECIIVDDGSTDETSAVAGSYAAQDARFSCLRQENRGLSAARNSGLRKARGELIQLLDADDLLEAEKLKAHARFLAQHAEYDLVYGAMRYFTGEGPARRLARGQHGVDREWMTLWPDTSQGMMLALIRGNQFPVSAALFRKSLLVEVGYFDETLASHEDWEFWLRCALAGKRFCGRDAPQTRTLIREHGQSLTRRAIAMAETRLEVRRRIEGLAVSEALRAVNRECASYDACELAGAHLAVGHWRAGLRWLRKGFAEAPRKWLAIRSFLAQVAPGRFLRLWRWLRGTASRGAAA
jgi:glycosyltransferase involved in cell wall biosynthesis